MFDKSIENLIKSLNDYELFKLVFPSSIKKIPASFFVNQQGLKELKNRLYSNLNIKYNFDQKVIQQLMALLEINKRFNQLELLQANKFKNFVNLYNILSPEFANKNFEEFWVMYISNAGDILHIDKISSGNSLTTIVNPNLIFRQAIILNAKAIILIHNHPSGNATPSFQDYDTTNAIVKAGNILEIKVIEHLIFGKNCFYQIIKDKLVNVL